MLRSIGDMLDDPGAYFEWMHDAAAQFGVLRAVARLGLLEALGPGATPAQIAARSGHDPEMVRRLIEYLAAEGVLESDGKGGFLATDRSRALREMSHINRWGEVSRRSALRLGEAIERGLTAYEVEYGLPVFAHFAADPGWGEDFGKCMSSSTKLDEDHIFGHHSFRPFELAVDVGGSQGSLLLHLLAQFPSARGILFDLPETAAQAHGPVSASGIGDRVDIMAGSFFETVPAGGDLYLLKQILHDWNDEECRTILANVRASIRDGGRLTVLDRIIPDSFTPHHAYHFDMVMMIWTTGRERRLSEFEAMFGRAGFALDRVTYNPRGVSVIEAVAV